MKNMGTTATESEFDPVLLTTGTSTQPASTFELTPIYGKRRKLALSDTDSPSTILDTDSSYHVEDDCSLPSCSSSTTPASQPQKRLVHSGTHSRQQPDQAEIQSQHGSLHSETKYLVFKSCLFQLFETCPTCQSPCSVESFTSGTLVHVKQLCVNRRCQYFRSWASQPFAHNIAAGNILLSAAILFSGASYCKVLRLLHSIGIKTISETTYKRHAREYLQPAVYKVWRDHQEKLVQQLAAMPGKPEVGGDGRADSPGHCAKYGSYTALELRINKVIDVQLVQSNEVGGSYHMEQAGLQHFIKFMREKDLTPSVLVTDRHLSIQRWIRENLPDCKHYYDVWHVAKGLSRKIEGLVKVKDCELAGEWLRSISNHMYWCAASSDGLSGDVIAAKWLSVLRHMQNLHKDHSELFPTCTHGPIENPRKWLKPDTKVFDKLSAIISNKRLLADIKKLSPCHQTSAVEAFHSLLIQFAPKSVAFSFTGMLSRMMLAAMHYNENSERLQAVDKHGKPKFALKFPKFKKGGYCVQPVKTVQTYNYVSTLMEYVLTSTLADPSEVWQLWAEVVIPPPLCSDFDRPDKSSAVASHTSRFCTHDEE